MSIRNFVGRESEIGSFNDFLRDDTKNVFLVVGKQGIGKSRLLDRLKQECYQAEDLDCITYSYELKGSDKPDQYLFQIMDDLRQGKKIFITTKEEKKGLAAGLVSAIPYVGDAFKSITEAFIRDDHRPMTDKFKTVLELVREKLAENERLILFIDPMDELRDLEHRDTW